MFISVRAKRMAFLCAERYFPFPGWNAFAALESRNYTDSADTGADFLASVNYVEHKGVAYVTDILYTQKPMEYTEPALARMLWNDDVTDCRVESNNGGRSFMRNVERLCREMGNTFTRFTGFTQTKNKQVRIFTRSHEVCNCVLFPKGWQRIWPDAAQSLKSFRREGRNAHDDIEDVLTGIVENLGRGGGKDLGGFFF